MNKTVDTTFPESTKKAPKVTLEPINRIISKQLDIQLGPFTPEELDSVLRKIYNRKAAGLDEIPPRSMEVQTIRWRTAPTL